MGTYWFQTAPVIPEDQKDDLRPRIISYNDPDFIENQMKKEVVEEVGEITEEEADAVLKLVEIKSYADSDTSSI